MKVQWTNYRSANKLANTTNRSERGSHGVLKIVSGVIKDSGGSPETVDIGTGASDLQVGDLILIDTHGTGVYDHATIFYEDVDTDDVLDTTDKVISARKTGTDGCLKIETLTAAVGTDANAKFILRVGW